MRTEIKQDINSVNKKQTSLNQTKITESFCTPNTSTSTPDGLYYFKNKVKTRISKSSSNLPNKNIEVITTNNYERKFKITIKSLSQCCSSKQKGMKTY